VTRTFENPADSVSGERFGRFAVEADVASSQFFGRDFPADGLLRTLLFESSNPIKYGANIGQSLQTIRLAVARDELIMNAALRRTTANGGKFSDRPFGLWTKCAAEFAEYFLTNWLAQAEPLAFLLYDSAPVLSAGAPVFVHSDKNLAFVARFAGSQAVSAYRRTIELDERVSERQRIWQQFRAATLKAPTLEAFGQFWDAQDGVRSLFLFHDLVPSKRPVPFRVYGRALEWGYPTGVGYRYVSFAESMLLLKAAEASHDRVAEFAAVFK
jgi:hypothetical protein